MNVWRVYLLLIFLNMEYTAADETEKPQVGRYWWEVGKIVQFKGELRFPILTKLYENIPASNADSECCF